MTKRARVLTALVGVSAILIGVTGVSAVAHEDPGAPTSHARQGYRTVRSVVPASAARFHLSSPDVRNGSAFPAAAYANTFGCSGGNAQPRLVWSGAPAGTKSYAMTMYDPDAPTGSGFWHWLVWDIPAGQTGLTTTLPVSAVSGTNDSGGTGYMGPCPPVGDIVHHYEITVYALDTTSLGLPNAATPAVVGFTLGSHILGYGRILATARR
jgi:Raf kinase inhibitor-like YbhB/YbcL family protein